MANGLQLVETGVPGDLFQRMLRLIERKRAMSTALTDHTFGSAGFQFQGSNSSRRLIL